MVQAAEEEAEAEAEAEEAEEAEAEEAEAEEAEEAAAEEEAASGVRTPPPSRPVADPGPDLPLPRPLPLHLPLTPPSRLGVGVSGAVYLLPQRRQGRLTCGGTHELTEDAMQAEPPCAAAAAAALDPSLRELCPGLAALGPAQYARAGVRALPPRSAEGVFSP